MKYYNKMLIAFITISIVYTLLIEAIFLTGYYMFAKYNFEKNTEANAIRAAEYTDFRIQSVRQIYQLIRSNAYASKYSAETPEAPNRFARLKLHEFIQKVHGSSSVEIQRLAASKLTDGYAILDNSTGDLEFFMNEFGLTRQDIDATISAFQNDMNMPFMLIETVSETDEEGYIVIVCDKLAYPSKMYVFAKFTAKRFINPTYTDNAAVAIAYGDEIITVNGNYSHEETGKALSGGNGYYVEEASSTVHGTRYFLLTTKPQFLLNSTTILIFMSGIVASFISIIIMRRITKGMYNPVKRLVTTIGGTFQTGDEFSFVQSRYKSLREQMDSVNSSLYKYSDNAIKKLLRDLLTGIISPQEATKQFALLNIPTEYGLFTSVLIKVTDSPDTGDNMNWNKLGDIKELLLPLLSDKTEMHSLIEISADTLGLIFVGIETGTISDIMKNLLSTIEPDGGYGLCAAVGPSCDRIENIYNSYIIANRMMLHADFDLHKHRVLTPDYIDQIANTYRSLYYPLNIEQSIINGVINNKQSLWMSALAEIMSGNKNLSEFAHLSLMLSTTAARIIDSVNRSSSDFFPDDFVVYLEFRSCDSIEEMCSKAEDVFRSMSLSIDKLRELSNESLGNRMKKYIKSNYHKNISLHDLADHMNMSRNYVSAVFKTTTGVNFKEFISELRYNMACEIIMKTPDSKLMDVADKVGCNSESLARLFLRYSGQTPSEFQKQILQERQG